MKKVIAALMVVVALATANAQVQPQPHQTFFDSVTGYFSSHNTNYAGILQSHKGTLWSGQDWQAGAHISTSLGLEYLVYKQISLDSETRFSDLTGSVSSQQIGAGYNVDIIDVRLTGFVAGSYNFDTDRITPQIGLRAKKLLTDHTFSFVGFVVPIQHKANPRIELGVGFVF